MKFVESQFKCIDGPYRGWVEHCYPDSGPGRLYYVTFGFLTSAPLQRSDSLQEISDGNAFQLLRGAMLSSLLTLRAQFAEKPVLFWRYAAESRFLEETDIATGRRRCAKILTRIAVPGAVYDNLPGVTPQGGEYTRV